MPTTLSASIRYHDNEYGAFEVMSVLGYIRRTFPDVIVCLDDLAWRDYNWFQEFFGPGEGWGAIRIAMRDGIRRGPRYRFRFQADSGAVIFGWVGRDTVGFRSDDEFAPELEQSLRRFLESLHLGQAEINES